MALATVESCRVVVPVGDVVGKTKVPAVAEFITRRPFNRDLPANTTSAAELLIPAETLPALAASIAIWVTVLKYLLPVAVPVFAPVISSV